MFVARLYGPEDLRVEETQVPIIGDNEILLKVKACAICGTDLRLFKNGINSTTYTEPRILGHEFSGIIEKIGNNVRGFSCGTRVAVAPNMGCGLCDRCISGNTHLCEDYKALGINLDGGMAEYVRIPGAAITQGNIVVLDNWMSFEEAALNEPFSCVYNGFSQCVVKPGDKVLIMGAGPIGLLHAKLAKLAGASKVIISDLSDDRLDMCKKIDKFFITLQGSDIKNNIMSLTKGEGLNVCITANSSPDAQASALELMAIGGRVNFFGGIPKSKEIVPLNTNLIHYRQLIITGSTRASLSQYRQTLRFLSDGIVSIKEFVTGRFSLHDVINAFRLAVDTKGLKNVIEF
jgi:L-iditol 2-dehydrogenase